MNSTTRHAFDLADAELATLWREGGRLRFRASGPLSAELAAALRDHRGDVLAALTAYPGYRREPGADDLTATDAAEAILADLPQPLRDCERVKWTADLASAWAKGIDGREAARRALAALRGRLDCIHGAAACGCRGSTSGASFQPERCAVSALNSGGSARKG